MLRQSAGHIENFSGLSGCRDVDVVCGCGTWPGRKADERRELSAAREMWMPLEWSRLDGLPTTIG